MATPTAKFELLWPADVYQGVAVLSGFSQAPWREEYLITRGEALPHRTFWAWDDLSLLSLPLPLPEEAARSGGRMLGRVA